MKSLLFCICIILSPFVCFAEDIYISQTSLGSNSGTDCSNSHSASWFNTSSNWANPKQAGKIGPGDAAHLCGVITSGLSIGNSGSNGSPITILFESGAKLSQPYGQLLNSGGKSYIIIDGGTNGIVEATDNGTPPTYNNQQSFRAIDASGSEYIEFKNLTIQNVYIHTSPTDTASFANTPMGIYINGAGNNISIHNNHFNNITWCIFLNTVSGKGNSSIYNNDFVNYDHGVAIAGSASPGYSGVYIYNNHFGSTATWDTYANTWHHDGIHVYHPLGYILNNLQIYDNLFDGDWGTNNTAQVFLEGGYGSGGTGINNTIIYNNVFTNTNSKMNNGKVTMYGTNTSIYNNTFIGSGSNDICVYGGTTTNNVIFKNNVVASCAFLMASFTGSTTDLNIDNNIYANGFGSNLFSWRTNSSDSWHFTSALSTWQNYLGAESHSYYVTDAGLNSIGIPNAGSAVITKGVNLTSLGITTLNSDKYGTTRPNTGAWDIGAVQYGLKRPNPPALRLK